MKRAVLYFILLSFSVVANGQLIRRIDGSTCQSACLEKLINQLIKRAQVSGLAIAVFNDNKIVYRNTFGLIIGLYTQNILAAPFEAGYYYTKVQMDYCRPFLTISFPRCSFLRFFF